MLTSGLSRLGLSGESYTNGLYSGSLKGVIVGIFCCDISLFSTLVVIASDLCKLIDLTSKHFFFSFKSEFLIGVFCTLYVLIRL